MDIDGFRLLDKNYSHFACVSMKVPGLIFRSGRISSVYIVGWLLLVVGHTFSKFVYFECCSVVMMVY